MNELNQWWVVTDLDGTLLDDEYNLDPAKEMLDFLKNNKVPIIACTSKTASEVKKFREEVNIKDPYIVENGGAIYGYKKQSKYDWELVLGKSYKELQPFLKLISEDLGYPLRELNDLSDHEIEVLTGLKGDSIKLARDRRWSIPFLNPPLSKIKSLNKLAEKNNVTVLQGNRMSHLLSKGSHKGKAVLTLKKFLSSPDIKIFALGDSPNDIPLLEVADKSIVIPGINGPNPNLIKGIENGSYELAPSPHASGWAASIKNHFFAS